MLKILQARLQQYVNFELLVVQAKFRKGRGIRDQIANICWINKKAREFQKNIYSFFMTMPKPLTVFSSVQFSSVAHLRPTLCNPMNCSTPGLPVNHQLPFYPYSCPLSWVCHLTNSSSVVPFSSCLQSFPTSGGQSIGVSASTSVTPVNTQD